MLQVLATLCVVMPVIILVAAASAEISRPLWRGVEWLSGVYAVLGIGLASSLCWVAAWADQRLAVLATIVVLGASLAVVARARTWHAWRAALPIVAIALGLALAGLGHGFLWAGADDAFMTLQVRYLVLAGDSQLPHLMAARLWNNESTILFFGDWNGSDRPPLQSGLLALLRPVGLLIGVPTDASDTDRGLAALDVTTSVVMQLLWVPAAYAFLRALGHRPAIARVSIVFLAATPLVFFNTVFTWPKVASAGLILAALAILLTPADAPRRCRKFALPIGVTLGMLAFLAHGGAAFTAPMLATGAVIAWRRRGDISRGVMMGAGLLGLAFSMAVYAPWWAFTKWADPSDARLLKWHFAGVTRPDRDTTFLSTLRHAYATATPSELIHARLSNLRVIFDPTISTRFRAPADWTWPYDKVWTFARTDELFRGLDFLHPIPALGFASIAAAIATIALLTIPKRIPDAGANGAVLVASFASLVLWALLLFHGGGATVHNGSFGWLMAIGLIGVALASRWLWVTGAGLAAQLIYLGIVYTEPSSYLKENQPVGFSPLAFLAMTVGCGLVMAGMVAGRGRASRSVPHRPTSAAATE